MVTLSGIVIEAREEQLEKALEPIEVTLLGIVTDIKDSQFSKAELPIEMTGKPR